MLDIRLDYVVVALAAALVTISLAYIGLLWLATRVVPVDLLHLLWRDTTAISTAFLSSLTTISAARRPEDENSSE
ncbi:MAG: hypothetical protein D6735_01180 [Acidobacteria bacterium]|nr:MAG: hypothetical protein D6735_01180 [Acidobacteriota bacterium]